MAVQDINISEENFEILQPIILVGRILGILPVRYVKYGNCYKLKNSLIYGIYSYTLTIFLSSTTFFIFFYTYVYKNTFFSCSFIIGYN